jgi:transposase
MALFDLTDFEWAVIQLLLPTKARGVKRADDRKVLNEIFWRLQTEAPWPNISARYAPGTACVNLFNAGAGAEGHHRHLGPGPPKFARPRRTLKTLCAELRTSVHVTDRSPNDVMADEASRCIDLGKQLGSDRLGKLVAANLQRLKPPRHLIPRRKSAWCCECLRERWTTSGTRTQEK